MSGFLHSMRHLKFGWLMVTLACFGVYMMIANDVGFRLRTVDGALDELFCIGLGWLIRSGFVKVYGHE